MPLSMQELRFVQLYILKQSSIGTLLLDAEVQTIHKRSATVTSHPIEAESNADLASNISDYVKVDPQSIQIDGIVTNDNSNLISNTAVTYATGGGLDVNVDPAWDAYNKLEEYLLSAESVEVVTALRTYQDMVFTDLSVTKNKDTANSTRFTATLKQIQKVYLENVKVADKLPTKSTKSKGKKRKKKVKDKEKIKKMSAADKLVYHTEGGASVRKTVSGWFK